MAYGPDEFPCTIGLSNGVVPENSTVTVRLTCDEELEESEASGVDSAATSTMAAGNTTTTPMVAGGFTMATLMAAVGVTTAAHEEIVTLMVTDEDGDVVFSESIVEPVNRTAVVKISDLEPGDYTISAYDHDGTECADPADLVVTAMPPGQYGNEPGNGLAATGATGLPYLAVAGGLLLAGIAALVVTRRARRKAA